MKPRLTERWYRLRPRRRRPELIERLLETVDLPFGAFLAMLVAPDNRGLRRAVTAVPAAAVYSRRTGRTTTS